MCSQRSGAAGAVGGYSDIHANLRYWLSLLADRFSRGGSPPIVYDIGANDGELTIPLAAAGAPVIAFEPASKARARLATRAAEHGIAVVETPQRDVAHGMTILPYALGARRAQLTLNLYSDDTFSSLYKRPSDEQTRYDLVEAGAENVSVETLDGLVRQFDLPQPTIVKIDVEGAERDVLRGATATITNAMPALIVEYSCVNCTNAGYDRREIYDTIAGIGYRNICGLVRNEDRRLHRGQMLDDCRVWNLVVLPDEIYDELSRYDGTTSPSAGINPVE